MQCKHTKCTVKSSVLHRHNSDQITVLPENYARDPEGHIDPPGEAIYKENEAVYKEHEAVCLQRTRMLTNVSMQSKARLFKIFF